MLEDEFDGLRTAIGTAEAAQPIQVHLDEVTPISEHDQSRLLITDNAGGCENVPNSPVNNNDHPSPSFRPVPPPSQQNTSTLSQAVIASNFTFTFPSSSSAQPMGQKGPGGRCSVCTKALCPRRHECNGSVNRAWCRHGHPPLAANEKIRWTEVEVECRIAADKISR